MSGSASGIRFELLGPLRMCVGEAGESVPSSRTRVVLAMLLLNAGRTVSVEHLTDAVWSGAGPGSARNQIQTCVSQLRNQFGGEMEIITDPAGYRLDIDPQRVDAHRFRALIAEAREAVAAGGPAVARSAYRVALGLWRGQALAGVDSRLLRAQAEALEAEREQATEECLEVELALGGAGELVAELTELVRRFPYRERLHAALMRALYRAGRQADALAAFRAARGRFRDELGTEPGEQLQRLHQAILNRDPDLSTPTPQTSVVGVRELPVEASCFVGRAEEVNRVRDVLVPRGGQARRPPVVVLYGPGGIGKSALAVLVAHNLAEQFPGGQLYVDLCGSTPGMRPLPAVEVLGRFLRRLGVHPAEVPPDEAEAAALFRSLTTDRRMLILLDNAAEKEQIAGLVPATPSCSVLVTSRQPLPTLDADDRLRLDPLPASHGQALLAGLICREQSTEPEAAGQVVALCGGLPLAIRVAAGRLAARPDLTITEYAQRLADRSRRLDELQLDDLAVRASIRTSYDALVAEPGLVGRLAARAFRMLGLLHVPDLAPPVLAAMLAEPTVETARAALDRLVDAQLVEPMPGGRYRLHDLIRLIATERAIEEDAALERDVAVQRAISYYTQSLWRATWVVRPNRTVPFGDPPAPKDLSSPRFTGVSDATTWIDRELASLVATLDQINTNDSEAGRLALWLGDALWDSLDVRCEWYVAYKLAHSLAMVAEYRCDTDLAALGLLLRGRSEACLGFYDAATTSLKEALLAMRALCNETGVALVLNGLGVVHQWCGETREAQRWYQEALDLATTHELDHLAARIQNNMLVCNATMGDLDRAAALGVHLIGSFVSNRDDTDYSTVALNLAAVQCARGDLKSAIKYVDVAMEMSEGIGDRMRMCEELIIRSEAKFRLGLAREAHFDVERAGLMAKESGYRYAMAAAERQRARFLYALGDTFEAEAADARSQETLAALRSVRRDPVIELLQRDKISNDQA